MNEIVHYPLPDWLKIAFLLAIPAPVIMTIRLVTNTLRSSGAHSQGRQLILFFIAYLAYTTAMGFTGAFNTVSFPPRVLLLTTLPFGVFLFTYVPRTEWFNRFLDHVTLSQLVRIHIFRLIGIFFILLALYDALPAWFGFIAGAGDIFTALTGLALAARTSEPAPYIRTWTLAWNTFGMVDILFTAISANVLTKLSIDDAIMGVDSLAVFPFYYIPALAPPIILFLHYITWLKLKKSHGRIS